MCVAITGIRNEGKAEGRTEGRTEVICLLQKLLADGRNEDIKRMAGDEEYRHQLMSEYGIDA